MWTINGGANAAPSQRVDDAGVYCVLSGKVEAMDSSEAELLATLDAGAIIGVYEVLADIPRCTVLRAASGTFVAKLNRLAFLRLAARFESMPTVQAALAFQQVALLQQLRPSVRCWLFTAAEVVRLEHKAIAFRQGESGTHFGVVIEGEVKLVRHEEESSGEGNGSGNGVVVSVFSSNKRHAVSKEIAILGQSQVVGLEACFLSASKAVPSTYGHSVVAVGKAVILRVSRDLAYACLPRPSLLALCRGATKLRQWRASKESSSPNKGTKSGARVDGTMDANPLTPRRNVNGVTAGRTGGGDATASSSARNSPRKSPRTSRSPRSHTQSLRTLDASASITSLSPSQLVAVPGYSRTMMHQQLAVAGSIVAARRLARDASTHAASLASLPRGKETGKTVGVRRRHAPKAVMVPPAALSPPRNDGGSHGRDGVHPLDTFSSVTASSWSPRSPPTSVNGSVLLPPASPMGVPSSAAHTHSMATLTRATTPHALTFVHTAQRRRVSVGGEGDDSVLQRASERRDSVVTGASGTEVVDTGRTTPSSYAPSLSTLGYAASLREEASWDTMAATLSPAILASEKLHQHRSSGRLATMVQHPRPPTMVPLSDRTWSGMWPGTERPDPFFLDATRSKVARGAATRRARLLRRQGRRDEAHSSSQDQRWGPQSPVRMPAMLDASRVSLHRSGQDAVNGPPSAALQGMLATTYRRSGVVVSDNTLKADGVVRNAASATVLPHLGGRRPSGTSSADDPMHIGIPVPRHQRQGLHRRRARVSYHPNAATVESGAMNRLKRLRLIRGRGRLAMRRQQQERRSMFHGFVPTVGM